jgi:hypothetical protein
VTHCRRIMLEELQRRNFAPSTVSTYLHAVEQFARHFKCRPDRLNQTHFRSYQAYLLRERKLRPLTVRLHVAALRFFFVKTLRRRYLLDDTPYPKAPQRLPSILSVEAMARLIEAADGLYHRTMLMMLYSTGMRSAELLQLQVADIDSRRMLIHIRQGKGGPRPLRPAQSHVARHAAGVLPVDAAPDVVVFGHGAQLARRQTDHEAGLWDAVDEEFLRRFLLHVLPARFVRIRYFGFLASRCRTVQLPQCRQALAGAAAPPLESPPPEPPRSWPCPRCGGVMRVIEWLTPRQIYLESLLADILQDTS